VRKDKRKLKQLFRLAYRDDLILHFRTEPVDTDTAAELVDLIGRYNNFDPRKVKEAMLRFRGLVSGWEVGREGSPVIYALVPFWIHQREYADPSPGKRIPEEERESLRERLKDAFSEARADEIDELGWGRWRIRFWWD